MFELYEKLFRYGITMIVRPDKLTCAYCVEFERESKHLRFMLGFGDVDITMFVYGMNKYLDRFIYENNFKPIPVKWDIWEVIHESTEKI